MSPRWSWSVAALVAILAMALSSCSVVNRSGPPGRVAPDSSAGSPPSVEQYADRDAKSVTAGLAKIDPCTVLNAAIPILDEHNYPERTIGEPDPNPLDDVNLRDCVTIPDDFNSRVFIILDEEFTETEHYAMDPLDFNGFTGYFSDVSNKAELICEVKFPVSFKRSIAVRVMRSDPGYQYDPCALVKGLAEQVAQHVAAVAGAELLFKYGERDENVEGACVHWLSSGTHAGCVPYRETDVPEGGAELVEAAAGNPHVGCVAALDIVRDVLGEQMEPIVYGHTCVFVEPTHSISFSIDMNSGFAAGDYESPEEDVTTVDVSGHPAIAVPSGGDVFPTIDYFVSTGNDIADPGMVNGGIDTKSPRGTPDGTPADKSNLDKGLPIMREFMDRYF